METSLLLHHRGLGAPPAGSQKQARKAKLGQQRLNRKLRPPPLVVGVMGKPKETVGGTVVSMEKTVYKDNWLARSAIRRLSESLQATSGMRNEKKGYESLVEVASMVSRGWDPRGQQEIVLQSLYTAVPRVILRMVRILLPPTKFSRESCAALTTVFCTWLVGHCEVKESEVQGRKEKNVAYIPKCRFLESAKCVGMCTNMCKIPTQRFLEDSIGMPVHMVPNFEDMSCQMIFGQKPPADDPALKQPCHHACTAKQPHRVKCSS